MMMKRRNRIALGLVLAACVAPATASAQGAPAPAPAPEPDDLTKLARAKFMEGVAAFDAKKYNEARIAFLQAYALKRHPAVLLNLGQSELRLGMVEDGGNHLQQFLREHKDASEDQKTSAREGIKEAQKRTGFAIIIVNVDGAELAIDNAPIGTSPLLDPYFVKPGKHELRATKDGGTATTSFTATRGSVTPVNIAVAGAATPAPTPAPGPTPMPAPAQPAPAPMPGAMPPYPNPGAMPQPGMGPQPQPGMFGPQPPQGDTGGRRDFFTWYTDKPIAWVLTGIAGLGVIGTVGFGIGAGVTKSQADDVISQIQAQQAANPNPGDSGFVPAGRQPCGPEDNAGADLPFYSLACEELRSDIDNRDLYTALMGVSIGVGVLGIGGTVLYYFLDPDNQEGGASTTAIQFSPVISPTFQGFGLNGQF